MTQTHRHFRYAVVATLATLMLATVALASEVLHQGQWTKKGFSIEGSWSIVEENGQRYVVLDEAFRTKSAPDLKLFLSPRQPSAVTGANATQESAFLGALESHRGAQKIAIPANVDLSQFTTLVLHCEKYSKLWGVALLG